VPVSMTQIHTLGPEPTGRKIGFNETARYTTDGNETRSWHTLGEERHSCSAKVGPRFLASNLISEQEREQQQRCRMSKARLHLFAHTTTTSIAQRKGCFTSSSLSTGIAGAPAYGVHRERKRYRDTHTPVSKPSIFMKVGTHNETTGRL
jgi:hypothetical protein